MDLTHSRRLTAPDAQAPARATLAPLAPPIHRASMPEKPWLGFVGGLRAALRGAPAAAPAPDRPRATWERAASQRRHVLLAVVLGSAIGAALVMASGISDHDNAWLAGAQVLLYALLFGWVSAGFFTAVMGFWVQLRGDPHALSAKSVAHRPIADDARTAVVMPICNEHVATVAAGLRATAESLLATGHAAVFDFFVLSDSNDIAIQAAEATAVAELRERFGERLRIHYRLRSRRTRRKAGNVADFCRRWGRDYRYMVVLDADSVMSGEALANMVRLMEAHPSAGIIQTAPQAVGLDTLHARAQQFAGRVTGRLFSLGMQYWQLGESHYWGHNAIIRVAPFMAHCALARLPGRGGLSGDILSHDFVEAALMRRAGFHVWLVSDLSGSYEQQPPNLLEELQRDRRWCQGNLQNARLIAEPGLHRVHRSVLGTGAMSYLSAPLWLGFIVIGALLAATGETSAVAGETPPSPVVGLWAVTLAMLALPRLLGVVSVLLRREQRLFGGTLALLQGTVLEGLLSVLQAPVRMAAHTLFVVVALTGLKLDWKSPPREASAIDWRDAMRRFAPLAVVALTVLAAVAAISPAAAIGLLPIVGPLLLAAPLAVLTSQVGLGERIRAARLLLIPEESWTPAVLRKAWSYADRPVPAPLARATEPRGPALVESHANAAVAAMR